MKYFYQILLLACILAGSGAATPALASGDYTEDTGSASDNLSQAKNLIKAKQWQAAIRELKGVNASSDPNWNNLLGYAYRRADPPDLVSAERYYSAALALDPKHLPTLEYLGEMRLQQGDLAGAEQQLAALKKATIFKSKEFKQLDSAIERYKENGNKYVPKD